MAIPKFEEDVEIVSKIPNYPGSEGGLSPEEFRAKFDAAAVLIKNYLNNVLIPEMDKTIDVQALIDGILDNTLTAVDKAAQAKAVGDALAKKIDATGGSMTGALDVLDPTQSTNAANKGYVDSRKKTAVCSLPQTGWQNNSQTVAVAGVTANNTVIVAPAADSFSNYRNFGVRCTGQGKGSLTFAYEFTPTADLNVNVLILE